LFAGISNPAGFKHGKHIGMPNGGIYAAQIQAMNEEVSSLGSFIFYFSIKKYSICFLLKLK
jgi:hypothetical protein